MMIIIIIIIQDIQNNIITIIQNNISPVMTIKLCFSEKEKQLINTVNYLLDLPPKIKGRTLLFPSVMIAKRTCFKGQSCIFLLT